MKKLSFALVVLLAVGCKTSQPPSALPTTLVTNTIPVPPGLPEQKVVTKKRTVKALSIPSVPDKWIVVRWDPSMETSQYRLNWKQVKDPSGHVLTWKPAEGSYDVNGNKIDVVALFKKLGVPTGWYQVTVSAVNDLFIPSEEAPACYLVWYPEL